MPREYQRMDGSNFSPSGLLRGKDVFRLVTLSRTTVWRRVRQGTFPAPVVLGATRIAWREADILAWINAQQPATAAPNTDVSRR